MTAKQMAFFAERDRQQAAGAEQKARDDKELFALVLSRLRTEQTKLRAKLQNWFDKQARAKGY